MQIIADLHIHSKYSRAVSPQMDLLGIATWAGIKGIHLMGTGDWTHPLWFREISSQLKETDSGIYELIKPHPRQKNKVRFLLTCEVSSIYSQGGKGRRVHNVLFAPTIEVAGKINKALIQKGFNLSSDGRPIMGLSSKDLLELVMEVDPRCLLIPAHIWTPWFSLFGSKSGFDSVEECFGHEGAKYIYGIETGLSSDPIMNWQVGDLDNKSILSSSDAHSGPKLGREATVFIPCHTNGNTLHYSYNDIADAIKQKTGGHLKIGYTIEFFPEEGKYHWTGHRSCNIKYGPLDEKQKGTLCPVCRRPLTVGVESRVADLAGKILTKNDLLFAKNSAGFTFVDDIQKKHRPFVSIVPLLEILTEVYDGSPTKAQNAYEMLTSSVGSEFDILLKIPLPDLEKQGGLRLKKAIEIIRDRKVFVDPGYDGVFGTVSIFKNEHVKNETKTENKIGQPDQPVLF